MLLALLALAAGAAAGWLAGRRVPAAAGPWRLPVLVPAGAGLLAAGSRWVGGTAGVTVAAVGYAVLAGFALLNVRRAGMVLVAAGLLANLLVIGLDGGMPVRGLPPGVPAAGLHHGLSSRDHLSGLADQIRVVPLHETVSPGDVLVALGGAVALYAWLEPGPAGAGYTRRRDRLHSRRRARRSGAEPAGG